MVVAAETRLNVMTNVPVPRKRKWFRRLLKLLAALVVLLVAFYFVATSSFFLRHVILPIASKSLGVQVTVEDGSISPFSRIVLRRVRVQSTGTEPLLTADEVRLAYHLRDILGGNMHVDEVTLGAPAIQIITNPDGTSNLDPFMKSSGKPAAAPSSQGKPSSPLELQVAKVALNNASVRLLRNYTGGGHDLTVVSNVNVSLENLQNGQAGKLTLSAG